MKSSTCWLGLLMVLAVPSLQAANMEIKALFKPDSSQPNKNVFINQTPSSGYCADYPSECADNSMFSIQLPIRFNSVRGVEPGESIPVKAPANWRQLTVTNRETQETETVEVRITGIGSLFLLDRRVTELTGETDILVAHNKLWSNGSWVNAPSPCLYSGVGLAGAFIYRFFWKTPVEAPCVKTAAFHIPTLAFTTLDFAYELRTPNPLGMSSGLYNGSLLYTMGPGGDFDFGPLMNPDDGSLTLDFALDVQHTLKVDLPPGGNKVALEPAGGWQQWIDGGRKPARIFRDQTFHISASSRFKVMMQCPETAGVEQCILRGGDKFAYVRTSLTLPAGMITNSGEPVNRYVLRDNTWSAPFQPSQYVDRQVGVLHFEVPSTSIENLLKPGISGTLSTNITVIWDSEV